MATLSIEHLEWFPQPECAAHEGSPAFLINLSHILDTPLGANPPCATEDLIQLLASGAVAGNSLLQGPFQHHSESVLYYLCSFPWVFLGLSPPLSSSGLEGKLNRERNKSKSRSIMKVLHRKMMFPAPLRTYPGCKLNTQPPRKIAHSHIFCTTADTPDRVTEPSGSPKSSYSNENEKSSPPAPDRQSTPGVLFYRRAHL